MSEMQGDVRVIEQRMRAILNPTVQGIAEGLETTPQEIIRGKRRLYKKSRPNDATVTVIDGYFDGHTFVTTEKRFALSPEAEQEESAAREAVLAAIHEAHQAASDVIAAADRNSRLMEDATRELHSTVNVVRWSNDLALAKARETTPV